MIELYLSAGLNVLLAWQLGTALARAKRAEQHEDKVVQMLLGHLASGREEWRQERQHLLDRIQARGTEDYAILRNIAMAEQATGEQEEEEKEEWRTLAARHPEFASVADVLEIHHGESDEEPSIVWIPTSIDRGYSLTLSDFFRKIGFIPNEGSH